MKNKKIEIQKEVEQIKIALNSSPNFFKYPIGNAKLEYKVRALESRNFIKFDYQTMKWI